MGGFTSGGSTGSPRGSTIKRFFGDMQDRAMFALIGTKIIYNVAWEDCRVDREVLDIREEKKDTILMITTGGCNVLDMLLERPAKVVAADLNPRQNSLLKLKIAAIKHLSYEVFFELFSKGNEKLFSEVFDETLRHHLDEWDVAYWDSNRSFFNKIMWSGMSGYAARTMLNLCRWLGLARLIDGARPRAGNVCSHAARAPHVLNCFKKPPPPPPPSPPCTECRTCPTIEAQRAIYAKYEPHCDMVCRFINATRRLWCPLIAVPANQLHLFDGNIVKHAVDNLFMNTHIAKDNYFYHGYMYGEYTAECCPRYLKKENFATLRSLVNRIDVQTGYLQDVAGRYPDGYFSRYILLDHMDWMPMTVRPHTRAG